MKKIVLLVIMSLLLLVGCSAPAVVQSTPEPEVVLPIEEPTPQWVSHTVKILVQEAVNEEDWSSGSDIIIGGMRFTDVAIPQGSRITTVYITYRTKVEPIEEAQYVTEEIRLSYEPFQPSPPPSTPKAHPYWRDVPTREELDAQEREMIESGIWGVRVTYPEFGSGTAFYFYEPNPTYIPGSYATEDEDGQAMSRLKEQFVYECKRQSCADLPNPNYAEVVAFLEEAEIGKLDGKLLPGYNGSNGCTLVSIEVKKRANERGIRCANVDLVGRNHAINAFETSDRGIVWFDGGTERTPCFDREDLFPLPWLDGGEMPTSIIRPLDYVVYIW